MFKIDKNDILGPKMTSKGSKMIKIIKTDKK